MEYTFDLSTLISLVSLLGSAVGWLWLSASRIAKLEVKVDTIWDFFMTKAKTDALSRGVATQNSPIKIKEESKQSIVATIDSNLYEELRNFYKNNKKLSDNDFALKIQKKFGDKIVKEMCIPNDNLSYEACLFIAIELAKNGK